MTSSSPNPALDGESRVGEIIAILSVASVLSTLVVSLRCYCRAVILRSFGLDDAIMVPAQVLTLASAVAIGLGTKAIFHAQRLSVLTASRVEIWPRPSHLGDAR